MHQHRSFDDFDAFEPERDTGRRHWIVLSLILLAVLLMSAGTGFALGRGVWAIPESAKDHLPRFLVEWLPVSDSASSESQPAALKDYAFELVETKARQGETIVSVRLVQKPIGKPISDAVIFARRLDMAPEDMPTMMADLQPVPSSEAGIYRFKTNLTMQGKWQVSLAAKIQGERGTVQNKLVFEAVP